MLTTARRSLLIACSIPAFVAASAQAQAQSGEAAGYLEGGSVETPNVVVRDGLDPNGYPPSGILDPVDINGVGQVITDAGGGFVGTCTGTLINPRTVIFAAHCVNTQAAESYGANTGGTAISVGFEQYNLPALRKWFGLDGGTLFATNTADALYNVEQVWYDPRSTEAISCTGPDSCFLQGDIALATLDTPAFDIPSWAMLFTPLDGAEHVTVTGYGNTGTNASVFASGTSVSGGFRRRAAENLVSLLGSMQDRNAWLFGDIAGAAPQMLYMSSFTDPNPGFDPAAGKFDFGIFGAGDVALGGEGMGAPGDSGGPLIVDQKYDRPVVIGTLSGSSRFFGAQPSNTYGTHSFYQPLYAFWQTIVANNPYVYASAKAGKGEWTDARHWVQDMDPAYMIDVNGSLVNSLPDTPEIGTERAGAAFGQICFLDDCVTLDWDAPQGSGAYIQVPGGPGSTGFVPDNVVADPAAGVKARYYDVTLGRLGSTRLSNAAITIDRLTIDGPAKLDIAASGSLHSLGDFLQTVGWLNVDGHLKTGEALMVSGILSGSGTFETPWLTTAATFVAPGGANDIGTLTVDGNMVMASASILSIDAGRKGADQLAVTGSLLLSDSASNGPSVVFSKAKGAAPRHGDSFTIASAAGGIDGTFGHVFSLVGVLRPSLTYTDTSVVAKLRAGSLLAMLGKNDATARAFASALDRLRDGSYSNLWNLYGAVDVMGSGQLTATLDGLSPRIVGESRSLLDMQSRQFSGQVSGRLSLLGTGQANGLTFSGDARVFGERITTDDSFGYRFAGLAPQGGRVQDLPEGMSGFVASGSQSGNSAYGDTLSLGSGQNGRWLAMGLENAVSDTVTVGMATGYAQGIGRPDGDLAQTTVMQSAAYAAYDLGGGSYAGLMGTLETARIRTERGGQDALGSAALGGATHSLRYGFSAEAGHRMKLGSDLVVTPHMRLSYERQSLSGFTEVGGETALALDTLRTQRIDARAGFSLAGSRKIAGWTVTPQLQADYVRRIDGSDEGVLVRFAAAPDAGIALPLLGGAGSWAEAKGGVSLTRDNVTVGAGFETAMGAVPGYGDRAMADLTIRF